MNGGAWLTVDGARVDVLLRDLDVALQWTERAIAKPLAGALPDPIAFPERLAEVAVHRRRFSRDFTLEHARMCARRAWVLNEKRLVDRAGLDRAHAAFAGVPRDPSALARWVDEVAALTYEGAR